MKEMYKDLRTALHAFLLTLTDNVHYKQAPSTETYPYIVYLIKTYPKDNHLKRLEVIIDGYDDAADSGDFEDMMFAVSGDGDENPGLDRHIITTADYTYDFTLENQFDIEEKTHKSHRQQVYYGSIVR